MIILAEIDSIGIKTMFLARVIGSTFLIFSTKSSLGWASPSYAQFFNSVVASTMAGGSR